MKRMYMRNAIAMIELIFAIVIIAISVLAIPSMLSIANNAAKVTLMDEDVLSRLSGWVTDKSQARWDLNYAASGSPILWIASQNDLNCSRGSGFVYYRANPDSTVMCSDVNLTPSAIPSPQGSGILANGIEQLNGGVETITVTPTGGGTPYNVTASYAVGYVSSTMAVNGNSGSTTWQLGSSTDMSPNGSLTNVTHLKRIVTRFNDTGSNTDVVLTFFKSNKGN